MIIRHGSRKRWTVVDQDAVNDERLTFRARGVLVWLLDKPDAWEVRSEAIAAQGIEGRDAIRTALNELEKHGYLERRKAQDLEGHWYTETWVFESPTDRTPGTDSQSSDTRPSVSQALTLIELKASTKESRSHRKGQKTSAPADWALTDEQLQWVRANCPGLDAYSATQEWLLWCDREDARYVRWESAWKGAMRRAARWHVQTGPARTYL